MGELEQALANTNAPQQDGGFDMGAITNMISEMLGSFAGTAEASEPISAFESGFGFTNLDLEGGGKIDESRKGIRSKFGMTQKTLNAMIKQGHALPSTVDELTEEDARFMAKTEFFDRPKMDLLPTQALQEVLFDAGIQRGPENAIKMLQEIVGAKPDTILGPKTVGKINEFISTRGEQELLNRFFDARELDLMGSDAYAEQGKGLINRINRLRERHIR